MAEPAFIRSQILADHGFTGIFTLREGGISPAPFDAQNFGYGLGDSDEHIEQNLRRLTRASSLPSVPHQAVQVHQTEILWCKGQGYMHRQQADILITDQSDTAIAVRVADCLPILLADPETGITAAVHAGWRGTAAGIAKKAVQAMRKHGARSEKLLASLGPCIGPCCFAVGHDTALALQQSIVGGEHCISHAAKIHADLPELNRLQLLEAGLSMHHIETNRACTVCESEHFFSFRRDGKQTGRHLAIVATAAST
ncbi:MAG: peptidoglycan editing factor PgeF [Mariprofundus sp.]